MRGTDTPHRCPLGAEECWRGGTQIPERTDFAERATRPADHAAQHNCQAREQQLFDEARSLAATHDPLGRDWCKPEAAESEFEETAESHVFGDVVFTSVR